MDSDWLQAFDLGDREPAPADAFGTRPPGRFGRLREGLTRSRSALTAELKASVTDQVDEETWEGLEEALILADVGAPTTAEVVRRLEDEVEAGRFGGGEASARAPDRAARRDRRARRRGRPHRLARAPR